MSVSRTSQTPSLATTLITYTATSITGICVALKSGLCNAYPKGDYSLIDTKEDIHRTFRGLCITGTAIVAPLVITALVICVSKLAAHRFNKADTPQQEQPLLDTTA